MGRLFLRLAIVLIATGTHAVPPDGIESSGDTMISSDDIGSLKRLPRSLAVVGAGVSASRRMSGVKWGVASRIVWAWVVTMPAAALMGALCLLVIRASGMH